MNRSREELMRWAHEHLVYEARMLMHSVQKVTDTSVSDPDRNAFIESFAIHVRCLRDFLWRDTRPKNGPEDALASDFCAAGAWAKARPELPDALREIEGKRNRIGREIVHLTYDRLDIDAEAKKWPMGELLRGIADALACFSDIADPERLDEPTRKALASLPQLIQTEATEARSPMTTGLTAITGASQAIKPGTIAFPSHSEDDITPYSST